MLMRPFFSFYGGKWRAAFHYPAPKYNTIIEPFAGSAGYAVRYYTHQVILVEKDPRIAAIWRYLISTTPDEVLRLPLIRMDQDVKSLDVCPAAQDLIGFWLNKAASVPHRTASAWMRQGTHLTSFWGVEIRARIASQVNRIKHWKIIEGNYDLAPDVEASWFIDPPYLCAGRKYKHSSASIDFSSLGQWCQARHGQVIVCENEGASWLPFQPFMEIKSTEGKYGKAKSKEAIWTKD